MGKEYKLTGEDLEAMVQLQTRVVGELLINLTSWIADETPKIVETKEPEDIIGLCQKAYMEGAQDSLKLLMKHWVDGVG